MATSVLSAADIADFRSVRDALFATRQATADPPIDLVLERGETVLAAQQVLLIYADRQARRTETDAAVTTFAEGTFEKDLPFDVAVNDRFVLGDRPGVITAVPKAQRGKQVAAFKLDQGSI